MLAEKIRESLPRTQEERDAIFNEIMNRLGDEDKTHSPVQSRVDFGIISILAVAWIAVMLTAASSGFRGLAWAVTGLFLGYLGSWFVSRQKGHPR
jgi:hypothetical protein